MLKKKKIKKNINFFDPYIEMMLNTIYRDWEE
jgi:hypothetical protein